jgi:uncharacterized protein (DUF362 family)
MSLVSFVRVQKKGHSMKQGILEALELINYVFPREARSILIKPNLCYYWDYSTGQTTDPEFVAALITIIRERISANVDISVAESDASAMKCRHAFRILGYEKMAEKYDVKLVNLSEDKTEKVEVSTNGQHFEFMVPKTILGADLRINVPKIKYMVRTEISCALKNIFGCNSNPNKSRYHSRLDETIVALNKIMKFDLTILDGIIVVGSKPRRLDLVMASEDPVAFDSAAARIAGLNPNSVKHIALASKEGLGSISFVPKGVDFKLFVQSWPKRELRLPGLHLAKSLITKARGSLIKDTV